MAEECLMVGNDVAEDMCTSKLGMDTFLLTEHLIPAEGVDTKEMRQGGFKELYNYIEDMPILLSLIHISSGYRHVCSLCII